MLSSLTKDLPIEIVINILSRLPVKTLLRLTSEPVRDENDLIMFCEEIGLPVALDETIDNIQGNPLGTLERSSHTGIVAVDGTILAWETSSPKAPAILKGHSGVVLSLIVGANNRLYSGSGDTMIKVWDIETLQCLQTLHGHSSVVMSVIYWFEALAEGLKRKYAELCSAFFMSATWLVHMLTVLPDTGIQGAARVCLLKRFVSTFKFTKDTEDRALSMLALNSFISDPEGLRDLTSYMKDLLKGLRELKKSSVVALEMLKVFSEGNDSSNEMWNHKELVQEDCNINVL